MAIAEMFKNKEETSATTVYSILKLRLYGSLDDQK